MELNQIINKTAYWGAYIFEATSDNINDIDVIRLTVFKSVPKRYETTFFVENKEKLLEYSETNKLIFYTGNLGYKQRNQRTVERINKNGRKVSEIETYDVLAIENFLESFKHKIE